MKEFVGLEKDLERLVKRVKQGTTKWQECPKRYKT